MDVISFPQQDRWRVFAFVEFGGSVLWRWIQREAISGAHVALFHSQLDLFRSGGPEVLPGLVLPISVKEGFYAMRIRPKRQPAITPIFCYGPIDEETEITFLAGAPMENGKLKAQDLLPIARLNRESILRDPRRNRNERIT